MIVWKRERRTEVFLLFLPIVSLVRKNSWDRHRTSEETALYLKSERDAAVSCVRCPGIFLAFLIDPCIDLLGKKGRNKIFFGMTG